MKKTYITHHHLKNSLLDELLHHENRDYLYNIEIVDHHNWLAKYIEEPSFLMQYQRLQELDLKLFLKNRDDLAFLKELLAHKKDIDLYDLDINRLDIDAELKDIFLNLYPINKDKLTDFLSQEDFSNYIICEGAYSLFEENIFEIMRQKGAKTYHFKHHENQSFLIKALNERQEIEKLAQFIISNDINPNDIAIELANPANKCLIDAVFKRYGLPYILSSSESAILAKRFVSLIDFYFEPNLENYCKIIYLNTFAKANLEINEYLKRHIKKDDFLKPLESLKEEGSYYRNLEEKAATIHNQSYPILLKLLSLESYKEALSFIYKTLFDGSKTIKKIKSVLIEEPALIQENHCALLIQKLLSIKEETPLKEGILVLDDLKPIYRPILFILDASNQYFPGFKSKKGLINERILKGTNFPSLESRLSHHLKNLDYLKKSQKTYYFVAESSFQGKDVLVSTQVENLPRLDIALIENDYDPSFEHALKKETAQKLFLKDTILTGSVSSFETYMQCPYRYFLNYGLGLKDPYLYDFQASTTGTIIHEVFETLINKYHKDYYKASKEDIENCLLKHKERFYTLFPNEKVKTDFVFHLFLKAILLEFEYLYQLEEKSPLKPILQEHRFDEALFDTNIRLVGSIDRIDEMGGEFCILDYKTSTHSISKGSFEKGLQLQLLTYLFIYLSQSAHKPLGAYYINTNHPRNHIPFYEYKISKGLIELDFDDTAFMKEHRLQGANFDKPFISDFIVGKKVNDLAKYKDALQTIYKHIYREITNGKIALEPIEEACKYCKYRPICRYPGGYFATREVLYNLGEEDATQ